MVSLNAPQAELIVFWDYASTYTSSASSGLSNHALVANIRSACLEYGVIKSFRAYGNFSGQMSSRSASTRSDLSSSGVTLADFPEDGQKDAGIKAMLVDIILHAWDHPDLKTYVIISNDRDIAYAVGVLRMRRYPVIVIASVTAHGDLTAQASVRLDWTKTVLGLQDGTSQSGDPTELKHGLSHYPSSAFSLRPQQPENDVDRNSPSWYRTKSSSNIQPPPMEQKYPNLVELNDLPAPRGRARSHSIFSYDQQNFEGFGALSETPMTPKMQNASSTLGDGPLFPRPRPFGEERTRAESLPPSHVGYSTSNLTKSVFPPFLEDETSSTNGWKGKGRDFPSHIAPPTTTQVPTDYARLDFNPFGENIMHFPPTHPPPPSAPRGDTTQGALTSSSSTSSRSSRFSTVHRSENTAITSVATITSKNAYGLDSAGTDPTALDTTNAVELPAYAPPAETSMSANSEVTAKVEKPTSPTAPHIPLLTPSNEIMGASATAPEPFKFQFTTPPPKPENAPVASSSHRPIPPVAGKPPPKAAPAKAPTPSQLSTPQQPTNTPNNLRVEYQHLISTLRRLRRDHPNGVPRSILGEFLPRGHSQIYADIPDAKKFKTYITKAAAAGVICYTQNGSCVELTPTYA